MGAFSYEGSSLASLLNDLQRWHQAGGMAGSDALVKQDAQGQWQPYSPPDPVEAARKLYEQTGIPDMMAGSQAFDRGEYLQALGQGAAGAASLAGMLPFGAATKGVRPLAEALDAAAAARGATRALAKPNIGTGSNAPLFDYSRLREVPDVPQFDLERYVPPRGVPERTEALALPSNIRRVNDVVQRGAENGGIEWYNTDPLRHKFMEVLGDEKGEPAYAQYMNLVAATSPRSKVGENVRNASFYYTQAQQGLPVPQTPLPSPYGHIAQRLHVQNAGNVLDNGGFPVLQNPKPASFVQNLMGNQQPVTIDTHNARLWGVTDSLGRPADMPGKGDYGFLERLQQNQAAKLGMSPAQYQASAWIGGGDQTGLKSSADPFLKVLEDRVRLTAAKRGMTPEDTLMAFIKGKAPLLSAPALGASIWGGIPSDTSAAVY